MTPRSRHSISDRSTSSGSWAPWAIRCSAGSRSRRASTREAVPARVPGARRAAGGVDRLLGLALELRDVRVAGLRRRGRQLPRLDRLRAEVHGRDLATLGGLPAVLRDRVRELLPV